MKYFSRKGAKTQRKLFGNAVALCAFAPLREKYLFLIALPLILFGVVPTTSRPSQPKPKPKYNVLLIASDDLRPTLGCYGITFCGTTVTQARCFWTTETIHSS